MASTYTQVNIQVVFTVQERQNLIKKGHKEELHKYLTGIVRNHEQKLVAISGMPDHVHVLVGLKPNMALSDLVPDIKSNSSTFIHEKKRVRGKLTWQEDFGAFSYGHSQLADVIRYTQNQERHHAKSTFRQEYLEMLKRFRVEHNEQYVFDWVEDK
jgi:REP element-mobilizing transposase RayT